MIELTISKLTLTSVLNCSISLEAIVTIGKPGLPSLHISN